jgi:hypothetical protein
MATTHYQILIGTSSGGSSPRLINPSSGDEIRSAGPKTSESTPTNIAPLPAQYLCLDFSYGHKSAWLQATCRTKPSLEPVVTVRGCFFVSSSGCAICSNPTVPTLLGCGFISSTNAMNARLDATGPDTPSCMR